MEHLSITFPEDLRESLDREAKRENLKRSTLIQKAVRVYLGVKHRKTLTELLREGYEEMAAETREVMREFEKLDRDSLKYVG